MFLLKPKISSIIKEPADTLLLTPPILKQLLDNRAPVILCIGTDRIIGDSLGPLVGSMLLKENCKGLPVYGTLSAPVHALHLDSVLKEIHKRHPEHIIIAVDASLGEHSDIGSVYVRSGSLQPGAGVSKTLSSAGDISITGVAAPQSRQPYLALQTTRLSTVAAMAQSICGCILCACT